MQYALQKTAYCIPCNDQLRYNMVINDVSAVLTGLAAARLAAGERSERSAAYVWIIRTANALSFAKKLHTAFAVTIKV